MMWRMARTLHLVVVVLHASFVLKRLGISRLQLLNGMSSRSNNIVNNIVLPRAVVGLSLYRILTRCEAPS